MHERRRAPRVREMAAAAPELHEQGSDVGRAASCPRVARSCVNEAFAAQALSTLDG